MKAAPFDYVRVSSLDELGELAAAYGDDAQVIAGGQSLVPAMAMRMARPKLLLDLCDLPGLADIRLTPDGLEIGAMVRYFELAASPLVAAHAPLVSAAVPLIAHEAIRSRGTLGGNLAHADPASEMPAVMLALGAVITVAGRDGARRIPAAEFFIGTYETALRPGEIITAITLPAGPSGRRVAIDEVVRRSGDYAAVGAAFAIDLEGETVTGARLAFFAFCDRAVLAHKAAAALCGQRLGQIDPAPVLDALADEIAPVADLHNRAETKRHLMKVLAGRLLQRLLSGEKSTHG